MRDPDSAAIIDVISNAITNRRRRILNSWIQDNGLSYKCSELLEAILNREPVYVHEKPSRQMEEILADLKDLNQKMEASALVSEQQERRLRFSLAQPDTEDMAACHKGWTIMDGLTLDFIKILRKAEGLRPQEADPLPEERHTLDEILHGEYSLWSADHALLDFKKGFFHRPFTLKRISAWEDFSHDVLSLKDSTCFLLDIILRGSRLALEESRERFGPGLQKGLEEHIQNLENALNILTQPILF